MTLWADADSLPPGVRELCARRGGRSLRPGGAELIEVVFVAARPVPLPAGGQCRLIRVDEALPDGLAQTDLDGKPAASSGADAADDYIMAHSTAGDILVTRDIPLAARAIANGLQAINDRGDIWSADSVRQRLSMRDRMAELRAAGLAAMPQHGAFGRKELTAFANALDKVLAQRAKAAG
ncbi:MAG: hypothetical protein A2004_03285 [Spirochaetes bacterium GWC1_61_12]|nr:MAG: hypothetical protein A2Y37_09745 [Spirochaetes bacterium GWB1_60_80]OHD31691.1 MAG: hypothetical protein A2004_03285 [Spirochaetes bacterium GWC1_61_12]OHD41488.1 MAG: hypothetical protein A2Y35_06050 [Spirochaetes bacterium GWE1_60_18]OHD61390.1 MAG: hypothetical protein A2Y32_04440 [Spirochaetes bacterium GWF1_60_12]HAP44523.1 hypothetical protein [Spirochaetaceae bacterium]